MSLYFKSHKMTCYYNKVNFPFICSDILINDIKLKWGTFSKLATNNLLMYLICNFKPNTPLVSSRTAQQAF